MSDYPRKKLREIANQCAHFDHVIQAMGYGYSLVNVSPEKFVQSCDDCVNWEDGNCRIFIDFLTH